VIFTELGGSSSFRGIIKLLTAVDNAWIKGSLEKAEELDTFRLSGIQVDKKRVLIQKKMEEEQAQKQLESTQSRLST